MLPSTSTMQDVTLHRTQVRKSLVFCIRQISTLCGVRYPRSVFYMILPCVRVEWEKEHGGLSPRSQTLENRRRHMWVVVRKFHTSHYTVPPPKLLILSQDKIRSGSTYFLPTSVSSLPFSLPCFSSSSSKQTVSNFDFSFSPKCQ